MWIYENIFLKKGQNSLYLVFKTLTSLVVVHISDPRTPEWREGDLNEIFMASLVYRVSSRTTRIRTENPILGPVAGGITDLTQKVKEAKCGVCVCICVLQRHSVMYIG